VGRERAIQLLNPTDPQGRDRGWLWTVAVLAACHAAALAAFQLLNVMVEPVKRALAVSDTQYSLIQGLAVAIFASVLGLPAARLADRGGRRAIVLAGVLIWSAGTLGCGLASSYAMLFAARMLVGFGEVLLFPAALSIIAQVTPPARLARAVGLFACGGPIGTAIALAGGGWLASRPAGWSPWAQGPVVEPWRLAFGLCALFGLAVALFVPTIAKGTAAGGARQPSLMETLRALAPQAPAYAGVSGGMIALTVAVYATASWAPTLLVRTRGATYAEAGRLTGLSAMLGGVAVAWLCGQCIDRLIQARRGEAALMVGQGAALGIVTGVVAAVVSPDQGVALAGMAVAYALLGAPTVVAATALQQMTPAPFQAQVMALHLVLLNLLALSTGPTFVALLTEHVFRTPEGVAPALAVVDGAAVAVALLALGLVTRRFLAARGAIAAQDGGT